MLQETNGGGLINPIVVSPPDPLRHPSSSNFYPNILPKAPSNRNPRTTKPSPQVSKDLTQTGIISPCSNLQGPKKAACALPAPSRAGQLRLPASPSRFGAIQGCSPAQIAAYKETCKQLRLPQ